MKKNISKISDLFIKLSSTTRCSDDNREMEVGRIGGALRFRETDYITDTIIADYYIGEIDTRHGFRFVVIEKRGERARTRHVCRSLEEALSFFNEKIVGKTYPHFTMDQLVMLS